MVEETPESYLTGQVVKLKSEEEIKILREGGKILSRIIKDLAKKVKPGVLTKDLDWWAENSILKVGGKPAFKNYKPDFAVRAYPATICASVNSVVVHGIPNNQPLQEGDILSLDIGMEYKKLFTDMAITVGVGKISSQAKKMIEVTKKTLDLAIQECEVGASLGNVGYVIEKYVRSQGFREVRMLTGHGVGYQPHEDPDVLNFGDAGKGLKLKEGMVIAIEPMISAGSGDVVERYDGSFITKEECLSCHFEHTVAITAKGPIILTK
jgi:methionyl aminopeptidase